LASRVAAGALQSGFLILLAGVTWAGDAPPADSLEARSELVRTNYETQVYPLLKTYCFACHGPEKHKADINLANLATGHAVVNLNQSAIRHCISKLVVREMPPEKEAQPTDEERKRIVDWLASLKRLSPRDPGPGTIRRMSRVEYANTLHDLLGVSPTVAAEMPNDAVGAGFNSAISPLLMEKYLLVADEVLDQLIRPEQARLKFTAGQMDVVANGKIEAGKADGGERRISGAGQVVTTFPAPSSGTYTFVIKAGAERLGKDPLRLAVRCDNQVVGELKITADLKNPAPYTLTCQLPVGKTSLALIVVNPYVDPAELPKPPTPPAATPPKPPAAAPPPKPPTPPPAPPGKPPVKPPAPPAKPPPPPPPPPPTPPTARTLVIDTIEITGPPAAAQTPAQKRLFVATPGKDVTKRDAARAIAESFARRAYRRPVRQAEVDVLLKIFDVADSQDEVFSEAVKLMLKAVLISPQFLFISADTSTGTAGAIVQIGDHQIAAKLSYLFWSTMPDDELAALADAGKLGKPEILIQQARRLVSDPRASAFFDGFGAQWLGLDRIDDLPMDEKKFPQMASKVLRRAMYDEAAMFFTSILSDNRSMLDLLDADFTFVNAPLAKLYGMDDVKGSKMQKVSLTDGSRGGVMTMAGVLAVTSLPGRTSPVKRGRWVLEQVLGQPTPQPPMNVAALEKQDVPENAKLNLRQRTERHRSDPACAGCHRVLDTIGFGMENYDPIGRWREKDDTGLAVDATGELPGRITFRSPQQLKRIIAGRKDEICRSLIDKMLSYALCRSLEGYDEVVAEDIAAAVAKDGYRFQTALIQIATSYPFLNRRINR